MASSVISPAPTSSFINNKVKNQMAFTHFTHLLLTHVSKYFFFALLQLIIFLKFLFYSLFGVITEGFG